MEDKLLTKKDLAKRWQLSERTIDDYRLSGIIVPIKGLPCIRFNLQYISKIEGKIPERTTMREKKLERQLQEMTKERDYLRTVFNNILTESNKCIGYVR